MVTMGNNLVVSATKKRLAFVKEQLKGKNMINAFFVLFLEGQSLNYIPDRSITNKVKPPKKYLYSLVEAENDKDITNKKT